MSTDAQKDFRVRREEVIDYIKRGMVDQGATQAEAITATTCIYFWGSDEVNDLFKCINSELPEHVVRAIVAHDFNGLSRGDECFLPKSYQFREKEYALSS